MGWNYPYISLEEMVKLLKGFVDIMILASGYQSSALLAHWDAQNIKKAIHWGSFFQNVLEHMSTSDVYQDSIKELDAALCQMKSNPYFPQGLANLSCDTLSRARSFVLAHLFQTLPLRDSHLKAFLTAVIEMELERVSESEHDCLSVYLNKLKPWNPQLDLILERRGFVKDSMVLSEEISQTVKFGKFSDDDLTKLTLQEVFKRQSAVSCISTVETGLDVLSNAIRCSSGTESDSSMLEELKLDGAPSSVGEIEQLVDFFTWNHWKSKMVSYFLDKRTIRLVSGASMIFSAPKMQWLQVFERLNTSADCKNDGLSEIVELLLLGRIASQWNCLIECATSVSYFSATISNLYYEVCSLLTGRAQGFHSSERATDSKESDILEYLARLQGYQLSLLWKQSPVLAAVAIPSWSPLLRLYLSEIETQVKGDSSAQRCCSCIQDRKQHKDCELAERIWCLYIFHSFASHAMHGANSS
ncbi:PREDICTED: uncharacterized protein LOC105115829 isoform X2 [Populus euphratica]|uniref:Uncharacterized protein LOC105115829 isoform X2 n=1 Tax=Populus euphratica TaxID=75702 RepID=A0AAJ6X9Z1_POPEU|nr:PREDICTED: uncharacterized protein LOC105115829 isoform X2 [Populus euphratica]